MEMSLEVIESKGLPFRTGDSMTVKLTFRKQDDHV